MNALTGLANPANAAQSTMAGFDAGRRMGLENQTRNALQTLASDPMNAEALAVLETNAPEVAAQYRERQDSQRFNQAAMRYSQGRGQAPGPGAPAARNALAADPGVSSGPSVPTNALTHVAMQPGAGPNAPGLIGGYGGGTFNIDGSQATPVDAGANLDPQIASAPAADFSALGPAESPEDEAFLEMLSIDAKQAFQIDSDMRDRAADRLKLQRDAYGMAISRLASVTDQAGYDAALGDIASQIEPLGIEVTDHLPPRFPGADGLRALRLKALDAKDQLNFFLDESNVAADNDRQDRNTESLIADREGRRAETRRNNEARIATTRRGQDMVDTRVRAGGSGKGGGSTTDLPVVATPAEAAKLPPGTRFRTPDGRVKVVPGG